MSSLDKPYKDICCKRCWFAKRKPCKCRCKGQYHQHGLVKQLEISENMECPIKCPLCETLLPKPKLDEVREGGTVMKDSSVGIPKKAMVALCPNKDCGYAYISTIKS